MSPTFGPRRLPRCLWLCLLACWALGQSGCASFTNPVANGIAVRRLPPELLGETKEDRTTIPLTYLRQKPPEVYRLEPGDVLGIWIEGVLGNSDQPPPVTYTEGPNQAPALGFPIPVREDGTISVPLVDPIHVHGMTLVEVEEAVREAYTVTKQILQPGRDRIIVTMLRPRRYNVLVVRQDAGAVTVGQAGLLSSGKRGSGQTLALPAYENDVLNALTRTGGLPGLEARNEVIIMRDPSRTTGDFGAMTQKLLKKERCGSQGDSGFGQVTELRIPLRLRPGEEPPFSPQDIVLQEGDIVFIEARDLDLFYTGGLLGSREVVLPRDYDLDVVEAVAQLSGPLVNGGFGQDTLNGSIQQGGIGSPNPSQLTVLRRTPGGGQVAIRVDLNDALRDPRERILVQPDDILILQETLGESFGRYFTGAFNFNTFWRIWQRNDATGTSNLTLP